LLSDVGSGRMGLVLACAIVLACLVFGVPCLAQERPAAQIHRSTFLFALSHGKIIIFLAIGAVSVVTGVAGVYGGGVVAAKFWNGQGDWQRPLAFATVSVSLCLGCLAFLLYK